MKTLIALCREAAVSWWRELPPLVRSRQFLLTTLMLACVGLLMALTQVLRGGQAPARLGMTHANAPSAELVAVSPAAQPSRLV
jgi:hypothetical protein